LCYELSNPQPRGRIFAGARGKFGSAILRDSVNDTDLQIRLLAPADAAAYRAIRLSGLKDTPEAFGSTFEAEAAKPLAWFFDRLTTSHIFGALRGHEILGVAGFAVRDGEKEAHKGLLWGMYVRPEARGTGVARRLVEAVVDFARPRVELIQLSVVVGNEPARRLYARLGFIEYGIEKNSLKSGGRYYDEILMAKQLTIASNVLSRSRNADPPLLPLSESV
jgi:RimJ/RimL family protein N-acetyltransferase